MSDVVRRGMDIDQGDRTSYPSAQPKLTASEWIRQVKGRKEMLSKYKGEFTKMGASTVTLDLHDLQLTSRDLKDLAQYFPNLTSLNVKNCDLSNRGVKELTKFTKLHTLDISGNVEVTGQALPELVKIKALKTLTYQGSSLETVTNNDASAVFQEVISTAANLTPVFPILNKNKELILQLELRDLALSEGQIVGLSKLFTNLHTLKLHNCTLTDAALAHVTKFSQLENLDIRGDKGLTSASLVELVKCTALKTLDFRGVLDLSGKRKEVENILREAFLRGTLSDAMKAKLKEVGATITELNLQGALVDPKVIVELFPNLQKLNLNGTNLNDAGFRELAKLTRLERLNVEDNNDLTGATLSDIAKFKALKSVALPDEMLPAVTKKHVELALRSAFIEKPAAQHPLFLVLNRIGSRISELDLHDLPLSDTGLSQIAQLFPNLQTLNCSLTKELLKAFNGLAPSMQQAIKKAIDAKPDSKRTAEEKTLLKIFARAEQIAKISMETQPMTPQDAFKLAHFIEVRLPEEVKKKDQIFKKAAYKLPRSIQYDSQAGTVYLLANHKISKLSAKGGFKKVSLCAQLRLNEMSQTPELFVRGLTLPKLSATSLAQTREEVELARRITDEISKRFPHLPCGIVPVHTVCDVTSDKEIAKLSIISPAFDGAFFDLIAKGISHDNLIRLAKGAGTGLYQLHGLGYVHADIKDENFVYKKKPGTDEIEDARVIDYGFVYRPGIDKPTLSGGSYATPDFTAPELFAVDPFTGDMQKADVFAFGVSFYRMMKNSVPPWVKYIGYRDNLKEQLVEAKKEAQELAKDASKAKKLAQVQVEIRQLEAELAHAQSLSEPQLKLFVQQKFAQSVEETIEVPLRKLQERKAPPLTPQEQFQCLIYKTMRLNPGQRITMAEFMGELSKIGGFEWTRKAKMPASPPPSPPQSPLPKAPGGPAPKKFAGPLPPTAGLRIPHVFEAATPFTFAPKPQPKRAPSDQALRKELQKELSFVVDRSQAGYEMVEQDNCSEICKLLLKVPVKDLAAKMNKDALYTQALERLMRFDEKYHLTGNESDSDLASIHKLVTEVQNELAPGTKKAPPKPMHEYPKAHVVKEKLGQTPVMPKAKPETAKPAEKPQIRTKEVLLSDLVKIFGKNQKVNLFEDFAKLYEKNITNKLKKDESLEEFRQRMKARGSDIIAQFLQALSESPAFRGQNPDRIGPFFTRHLQFFVHPDKVKTYVPEADKEAHTYLGKINQFREFCIAEFPKMALELRKKWKLD